MINLNKQERIQARSIFMSLRRLEKSLKSLQVKMVINGRSHKVREGARVSSEHIDRAANALALVVKDEKEN